MYLQSVYLASELQTGTSNCLFNISTQMFQIQHMLLNFSLKLPCHCRLSISGNNNTICQSPQLQGLQSSLVPLSFRPQIQSGSKSCWLCLQNLNTNRSFLMTLLLPPQSKSLLAWSTEIASEVLFKIGRSCPSSTQNRPIPPHFTQSRTQRLYDTLKGSTSSGFSLSNFITNVSFTP